MTMQPNKNSDYVKFIIAAIVGFILFSSGLNSAFGASATGASEPHPHEYGSEPCVTKQYDMAVSQQVFTDDDMARELHFIGCTDNAKRAHNNYCTHLAYDVARQWLKNGQPILNLTIDKMGRALDGRMRNNKGMKDHDCTFAEDWSIYYD